MLPNIGYGELLIILVLALLLFGAKRIPEIARSLGKSIHAFKAGMKEGLKDEAESKTENKKTDEDKKA